MTTLEPAVGRDMPAAATAPSAPASRVSPRPASTTSRHDGAAAFAVRHERARRARGITAWREALGASAVLVAAASLAFFLASGPMEWFGPYDAVNALGRLVGIVATVVMLVQVLLAARAPFVEKAIGHDRSLALHAQLGEPIFYLLVAHAVLLTIGWGAPQGRDIVEQTVYFYGNAPWVALSVIGLGLLLIVGVTSIAAVRRQWPYETWHAIHLATYAAIAMAAPHQFFDGSSFRGHEWATWFWIGLYAVAFGSLLTWRVGVPAWRAARHGLRVESVDRRDDGTVTVAVVGRGLERWFARPGQFFLWRFWTPDTWLSAHPYSLSAAPDGRSLRLTVKPLGDDSMKVAELTPGVRVSASGPYGVFTHARRLAAGTVLIGAGVGVTPLSALLEDPQAATGPCDVIIRARSRREAPLIDEIEQLAARIGARVHVFIGPRGSGWSTADAPQRLIDIVPELAGRDVYVCGPNDWADQVERDARDWGVPADQVHREVFGW